RRRRIHPPLRPLGADRRRPRGGTPAARSRRGGGLMAARPTEPAPPPPPPAAPHQMWGSRFSAGPSEALDALNRSLPVDHRLWTLEATDQVAGDIAALGRTLVARAQDGVDALLPGYTHGQRAQPVRWAYVLLAHAWPLVRDRQRLADARRRVAELPLGSGALAGSGCAVDRVLLKEALGFRSISANALDATGDRDFVAEVLFALALVGT